MSRTDASKPIDARSPANQFAGRSADYDADALTPREALDALYRLKRERAARG